MRHGQVKQYTHGYKKAVGVLFYFNSHGDADLTHITEQNICFHVRRHKENGLNSIAHHTIPVFISQAEMVFRIHNTSNIVTDTLPLCFIAERIENRVLVLL